MTDGNHEELTRRTYVKGAGLAGAAGLAGLAGCTGGGDGDTSTTSSTTGDGDGDSSGGTTLKIQHWWTGGDGSKAVEALFEGFEEKHSDISIKSNPVSGGAGQNLKNVIKKRILNNNPPSTWQAWPGKNLTPFVEADKLNGIGDSVWSTNGMKDSYLAGPKNAAKLNGSFYAVPLNIHRLNNLFYNVEVVEEADVDPSSISKPSDLVAAMQQVEEQTDAVGMAHQTKSAWSTGQLWAQVLLGEAGVDTYNAFTSGKVEANEAAVRNALSIVKEYEELFNEDAGSLTWQKANGRLIDGKAAFFHQGDWAAGMYRSEDGFEFEKQWGHVPFPGTEGIYSLNMDSFAFPKNNPTPEATKKFLQYVGSVDAQKRFNPKKGSIPPRTDVPQDAFGPFLTQQMDEFKNSSAQPPSIQHGLAMPPEQLTKFEEAMKTFTSDWNVDKAYNNLTQVFA
ncbi:ABC transporter substrate-binding protein [Halomicrococcus gelatinilyticus]|uniref:ABC transporter substrate-binding protein n=1 Tax=Halomicrococcus gelatinilyticus TaxID=1702103 RepID=UPI002E0F8F5E